MNNKSVCVFSKRKKNILIIPSWYPTKKIPIRGIFFKEQAEGLADLGLSIQLYFSDIKKRGYLKNNITALFPSIRIVTKNKVRTIHFQCVWPIRSDNLKLLVEKAVLLFLYLIKIIEKPDIIHAHSIVRAGMLSEFLSKITKCPFVVTEHNSDFIEGKYPDSINRKAKDIINSSFKTIAVSSMLKQSLEIHTRCNENKVICIPNMVDCGYFDPGLVKQKNDKEYRFITVAGVMAIKGIDILIKAFYKVSKIYKSKLFICGTGPLMGTMMNLVRELGLENNVLFLGSCSREGVRSCLANSDIYVSSSLIETFGVSIIEALAEGLPVVATKSGGPQDIINDENGILVEVGNVESLADGMEKMVFNLKNYSSGIIREDCIMRFGKDVVLNRIRTVYDDAIK